LPNYNFENRKTGKVKIVTMKMAELDDYRKAHPELEQVMGPLNLSYRITNGGLKNDNTFKNRMKFLKKGSGKGSTIDPGNISEI
jgi:hypothetical protein